MMSETQGQMERRQIGPDEAKRLLSTASKNRNLKQEKLAKMAADMVEDHWPLSQPIAIDSDGRLIDGQHRMLAIVRSGTTQWFWVWVDAPAGAQAFMDDTSPRTLADLLHIAGEPRATNVAATLRYWWRWHEYGTFQRKGPNVELTNSQGLALFGESATTFREASRHGMAVVRWLPTSSAVVGALSIIFDAVDEADSEAFWGALRMTSDAAGRNETAEPLAALRRRLRTAREHASITPPYIQAAWIVKSWNAWRRNDDLSTLRWAPGGASPEPFPTPV